MKILTFAEIKDDISSVNKRFTGDFKEFVNILRRPYFKIDKSCYDEIMNSSVGSDFIMYKGELCTFGTADCGYAIMPTTLEWKNQNNPTKKKQKSWSPSG